MRLARVCLDTLEYCGELDPIAAKFQIRLSGIYNKLQISSERLTNAALLADSLNLSSSTGAIISTSEVARRRRTEDWINVPLDFEPSDYHDEGPSQVPVSRGEYGLGEDPSSPDYLLTIPVGSDKQLVALSYSLLFALCRPWGEREETKTTSNFSASSGNGSSSNTRSGYASTAQSNETGGSFGTTRTGDSEPVMPSWENKNTSSAFQDPCLVTPELLKGMASAEWTVSGAQPFTWDTIGMLGYTAKASATTPGPGLGEREQEKGNGDKAAKGCSIMTGFPISMPTSACFLGSEEPSGWKGAPDIIMVEELDEDDDMESNLEGERVAEYGTY